MRACFSKAQNRLLHPTDDKMEKENSLSFNVSANSCVLKLDVYFKDPCDNNLPPTTTTPSTNSF